MTATPHLAAEVRAERAEPWSLPTPPRDLQSGQSLSCHRPGFAPDAQALQRGITQARLPVKGKW
jgi:hypothetical protein